MLQVAKMSVWPYDKGGKMVAFADIYFSLLDGGDGVLIVRGCKIFKADDGGYNIALPTRKDDKDNKYYPVVSIDKDKKEGLEFLTYLNQEATKAYNSKVRNGGNQKPKQQAQKQAPVSNNKSSDILDADLLF